MIYALIFAVISAVAGIFGLVQMSPGGALVAKTLYLASLAVFLVFLGLAKLAKAEEQPSP